MSTQFNSKVRPLKAEMNYYLKKGKFLMRAENKKETASSWLWISKFVFAGDVTLAVMQFPILMGMGGLDKWPVAMATFKDMA